MMDDSERELLSKLRNQKCVPCSSDGDRCSEESTLVHLAVLPGWKLTHDGQRIRKDWRKKNFLQCLAFFEAVGVIAEAQCHHPDLHLEGYRNAWIEIWTHDIDGLSENDFALAAKIDALEDI